MKMTRRTFLETTASVSSAALCGCVTSGLTAAKKPGMVWGALLHLGGNFWDDAPLPWDQMPTDPEAAAKVQGPSGKPVRVRNYVRCEEPVWQRLTKTLADEGANTVCIDLGEAMVYPSHPELAVKGSWSFEKVCGEINRLKALGLTAVPKLNFSTCHDAWLKDYGRMVSTPEYYRVCRDVIKDVCDAFREAPYFHLGFDEEMPIAQFNNSSLICRQGDLWWHDLLAFVAEVEKRGKCAMVWSDYMWTNRRQFLKRMPKTVLQCNWYYRLDFGEKMLKWNEEFEKKGGWGECVQGVAAFLELEKAGYDQLPCTSNYFKDGVHDPFVAFCKAHIAPERLTGFMTAPWALSVAEKEAKIIKGFREFLAAKRKYYA